MNSHNQTSRYSRLIDKLTGMDIVKGIHSSRKLSQKLSRKHIQKLSRKHNKPNQGFVRELPWYWVLLLCLLLFVNDVIAAIEPEQRISLIILDRSVEQVDRLLADFRGELHLLIVEESQEPFEQINQALYGEPLYSNVTIIAKASSSAIYLGGRWIDQHYLLEHQQTLATFSKQFANDSQLSLYTTNLTVSHGGGEFIGLFENLTQLNVDVIYMQGQHYEPLWVQRAEFDF
ncbi:DUF4347 domain-containing protein [Shewanella sp. 125m-7]